MVGEGLGRGEHPRAVGSILEPASEAEGETEGEGLGEGFLRVVVEVDAVVDLDSGVHSWTPKYAFLTGWLSPVIHNATHKSR